MANPCVDFIIQLGFACRINTNTYFLGYFWFLIQVNIYNPLTAGLGGCGHKVS